MLQNHVYNYSKVTLKFHFILKLEGFCMIQFYHLISVTSLWPRAKLVIYLTKCHVVILMGRYLYLPAVIFKYRIYGEGNIPSEIEKTANFMNGN